MTHVEAPSRAGRVDHEVGQSRWGDGGPGLVFVGDVDRYFRAFDVRTGEALWETRLGTAAQGFPSLRARLDQASGQCRHLPLNYSVPFLSLDSIMFSTFSGVRYAPSPAPAKCGQFRYCASRNFSSGYGFGVFMASSIASTTWLASS